MHICLHSFLTRPCTHSQLCTSPSTTHACTHALLYMHPIHSLYMHSIHPKSCTCTDAVLTFHAPQVTCTSAHDDTPCTVMLRLYMHASNTLSILHTPSSLTCMQSISGSGLDLVGVEMRLHGGTVVDTLNESVTHVVLSRR